MKRLISAAIALTLLGTAAASAQSYRHGGGYGHGSYSHGGYSRGYNGRNDGALIGLGIGLFALGAIAASSHDRYDDRYEYGPPPPPAYGPRGYDNGYNRGYGYGY
jgi:hypothetical protein